MVEPSASATPLPAAHTAKCAIEARDQRTALSVEIELT